MIKNKKELMVIGGIVLLCIYGNLSNYLKHKQMSKHMQHTCASVTEIISDRYGVKVFYSFTIKESRYEEVDFVNKLHDYGINKYRNKQFIVAYDSTNIDNNYIIMFQEYLADYNISIEDWNACVDSTFKIQE